MPRRRLSLRIGSVPYTSGNDRPGKGNAAIKNLGIGLKVCDLFLTKIMVAPDKTLDIVAFSAIHAPFPPAYGVADPGIDGELTPEPQAGYDICACSEPGGFAGR